MPKCGGEIGGSAAYHGRIEALGASMWSSGDAMNCPSANVFLTFLEGQLPNTEACDLQDHVTQCAQCMQVLKLLASSMGRGSAPPSAPRTSDPGANSDRGDGQLAAGEQVDHYEVVRLIARGGMGEVYLARDLQLDRFVAIKVVHNGLVQPDAVERFLFEARTQARFNHPNIVTVYGVGHHLGVPYLALEYVEGETLRQRMHRGSLSTAQSLTIAFSVAQAAVEAHRHGVVHGDLKPSNVLLASDGRVRTFDFGLAWLGLNRTESDPPSGEASHWSGSQVHGTPRYMAPELLHGDHPTPASDVWAFASMLFEMFALRTPFEPGEVATGRCNFERVCRTRPLSIPNALREALCKCFQVDPDQRPTMAELLAVIDDAIVQVDPASSRPAPRVECDKPAATEPSDDVTLPCVSPRFENSDTLPLLRCGGRDSGYAPIVLV